MRCLYCGKQLPLFKRLAKGEFCSDDHRQRYQQEYSQLALSRLMQAMPQEDAKPKNAGPIQVTPPQVKPNIASATVKTPKPPVEMKTPQEAPPKFVPAPSEPQSPAPLPASLTLHASLPKVSQPSRLSLNQSISNGGPLVPLARPADASKLELTPKLSPSLRLHPRGGASRFVQSAVAVVDEAPAVKETAHVPQSELDFLASALAEAQSAESAQEPLNAVDAPDTESIGYSSTAVSEQRKESQDSAQAEALIEAPSSTAIENLPAVEVAPVSDLDEVLTLDEALAEPSAVGEPLAVAEDPLAANRVLDEATAQSPSAAVFPPVVAEDFSAAGVVASSDRGEIVVLDETVSEPSAAGEPLPVTEVSPVIEVLSPPEPEVVAPAEIAGKVILYPPAANSPCGFRAVSGIGLSSTARPEMPCSEITPHHPGLAVASGLTCDAILSLPAAPWRSRLARLEIRDFAAAAPLIALSVEIEVPRVAVAFTQPAAIPLSSVSTPPDASLWAGPPHDFQSVHEPIAEIAAVDLPTSGLEFPPAGVDLADLEPETEITNAPEAVHAEPLPLEPVCSEPVRADEDANPSFTVVDPEPSGLSLQSEVTPAEPAPESPAVVEVASLPTAEPAAGEDSPVVRDPKPATLPIPIDLEAIPAGKAKPVQVFTSTLRADTGVDIPRYDSLPLRPTMVIESAQPDSLSAVSEVTANSPAPPESSSDVSTSPTLNRKADAGKAEELEADAAKTADAKIGQGKAEQGRSASSKSSSRTSAPKPAAANRTDQPPLLNPIVKEAIEPVPAAATKSGSKNSARANAKIGVAPPEATPVAVSSIYELAIGQAEVNRQQAELNRQQAELNRQQAELYRERLKAPPRPAVSAPSIANVPPAPSTPRVAAAEPTPVAAEQRPAVVDPKPAAAEPQPAVAQPKATVVDPVTAPPVPIILSAAAPVTPETPEDDLGLPQFDFPAPTNSIPAWGKIATVVTLVLLVIGGTWYFAKSSRSKPPEVPVASSVSGGAGPDWIENFSADAKYPRTISVLRSSQGLSDYAVEFSASVDVKALGWVFRAKDPANFYVGRIEQNKTPAGVAAVFVHFPVINGVPEERKRASVVLPAVSGTVYKIRLEAYGDRFTAWIQDRKVDEWTDARLAAGGAGLYSESGERALLQGAFQVVPRAAVK